jgi:hypothetical protein
VIENAFKIAVDPLFPLKNPSLQIYTDNKFKLIFHSKSD